MTEHSANEEESRVVRERVRLDRLDTSQKIKNFRRDLVLIRRIRRFAVGVEEKRGRLSRQKFRRASVLMSSEIQNRKSEEKRHFSSISHLRARRRIRFRAVDEYERT